jgi:hypothetical protein
MGTTGSKLKKLILIGLILICPLFARADDDVSIKMSLSQEVISLDGAAYLLITINSTKQDLPEPQLPNLSMFDVYSQGTSTNISIVNGAMQRSVTYNYQLRPRRVGTFVIKPASIVYNHKRYETKEITLQVIGSGQTPPPSGQQQQTAPPDVKTGDDIFLTAELDKKSAFVNEQVTLSVKFYSAIQLYSQPDYTQPQTTDFWADMMEPQKTYYQMVKNRRYRVIEINTALFPTRAGELSIGSAMVTARVPVQRRRRRNDPFSVFDDFFGAGEEKTIRSKPLKIDVKPLPSENKPDNYTGSVGNYKISATADKMTAEVNQPVTVTYRISGTGNIKTIAEPVIGDLNDFRVYRASSSEKVSKVGGVVGGTKVFEEVYIPKRAGKLTIPGVSLNYFNPAVKKYQEISTKSILISVKPAEEVEYADIPIAPVAGRVIDTNAKDIRYIKTDPYGLALSSRLVLFQPYFLVLNGIPILLLAVVLVGQSRRRRLATDIGYARSRLAKKKARKRLAVARKLTDSGKPDKFYYEIRQALFSYVADKLNVSPHGLTSDRVLDIISESGAGEELIKETDDLLKRADFAQYSSVDVDKDQIQNSLQAAEKIMVELEGIDFE